MSTKQSCFHLDGKTISLLMSECHYLELIKVMFWLSLDAVIICGQYVLTCWVRLLKTTLVCWHFSFCFPQECFCLRTSWEVGGCMPGLDIYSRMFLWNVRMEYGMNTYWEGKNVPRLIALLSTLPLMLLEWLCHCMCCFLVWEEGTCLQFQSQRKGASPFIPTRLCEV